MEKLEHLKNLDSYLLNINPKSFLELCERLLQKLYPENDIQLNGKNKSNYCVLDGLFYKPHHIPFDGSTIDIKSIINSDLITFSKQLKTANRFIYITNSPLFEINNTLLTGLRGKNPKLKIEVWSPVRLRNKLITLSDEELQDVLGDYNLYEAYQTSYTSIESDRDILQEIFSYLFINQLISKEPPKLSDKKATKIRKKIKINFSQIQHSQVSNSFKHHLRKILLVEKFIQDQMDQNEDDVFDLAERIQIEYCRINKVGNAHQPINDQLVFEDLARIILESSLFPKDKIKRPNYVACAKSIVLFFFEICDIGRRTQEEEAEAAEKAKGDPILPFPEE